MGFELCIDLMHMLKWIKEEEFVSGLKEIEKYVDVLYLVDSYGAVFPHQVEQMRDSIKKARKYKFETSSKAGIAIWGYGIREVCPHVVFKETIEVEFDNLNFKGPKHYQTYLTNVYGDYMKLPPNRRKNITTQLYCRHKKRL